MQYYSNRSQNDNQRATNNRYTQHQNNHRSTGGYIQPDTWYIPPIMEPPSMGIIPPIGELPNPGIVPPIAKLPNPDITPPIGTLPPNRPIPPVYIPENSNTPSRRCLNHVSYVWTITGNSFWMFPTEIRNNRLYGYRYNSPQSGWFRYDISMSRIVAIICPKM